MKRTVSPMIRNMAIGELRKHVDNYNSGMAQLYGTSRVLFDDKLHDVTPCRLVTTLACTVWAEPLKGKHPPIRVPGNYWFHYYSGDSATPRKESNNVSPIENGP